MQIRDFKAASALFLDSLASFTATELVSFEEYAFLSCITGMLSLDRVTLKSKLIDSPEVLSVAKQMPAVRKEKKKHHRKKKITFFS